VRTFDYVDVSGLGALYETIILYVSGPDALYGPLIMYMFPA
jgi:hypothetical protein